MRKGQLRQHSLMALPSKGKNVRIWAYSKKSSVFDLQGYNLVIIAIAWIAGIILASQFVLPYAALLAGAGIFGFLIILWYQDEKVRLTMIFMCCTCLGAWWYSTNLPSNHVHSITSFINTGLLKVRGSVTEEPKIQGHSRLLFVAASGLSQDSGNHWQEVDGQVEVQTLDTALEDPYGANYGDSVELQGKLQSSLLYSPAGIFVSMSFPRISITDTGGNPIIAFLYHLRVVLSIIIEQALPQPEAALLVAIVLGLSTPALQPLKSAFSLTGTVHLIVPSGFKVTILAGLVSSSIRIFHRRRKVSLLPAEKRRDWRSWLTTGLVVISITAYTLLSGSGPAAIRAGIMGSLIGIAPRLGRVYNVYTALAFAALVMSYADPFILWDVGFQLTFMGTLGIVLFTPYFQRLLHPLTYLPFGHIIVENAAVTLAAEIATLPIVAITFGNVSFIAPLANILTVPLLGVLILLGMLICVVGIMWAPLAWVCGWVAWPVLWYTYTIVNWCVQRPGAYTLLPNIGVYIAWIYYLLLTPLVGVLLWCWPINHVKEMVNSSRHIWRIAQVSVAILLIVGTGIDRLITQPNGLLTVTFLSVGPAGQQAQGEAILVRTPDGKTMLIDGGMDVASLSQALDSQLPPWQRSLDAVLLTCPRQDHLVGLVDIVMRYAIGDVIDAGMLHPNTTYARWQRTISEHNFQYTQVLQGDTIALGTTTELRVLWPTSQLHSGSNEVRDNGLIIQLIAPGLRMLLLSASAQSDYALAGLTASTDASVFQSDIVQIVGEAGKPISQTLVDILQRIQPSMLIITPAALSAAQRKAGLSSISNFTSLQSGTLVAAQMIQTAQTGTFEITSHDHGWSVSLTGVDQVNGA